MPITLAQAKVNVPDALSKNVIDEFRKSSFLLDNMIFDNVVSPVGGGATMTYGYNRVKTQPTASFREINSEYTPQEVDTEHFTVDLKIFGGAFQIDRVIADMGGIINEVTFQMQQKIKAARALFHDTVINGDSAVDSKAFDGLDKAIAGSSTEYNKNAYIDLSTSNAMDTNYKAFLDALDDFLSTLDGKPSFLAGNSKLITKIKSVARRAGYFSQSEDAFGRKVDNYDGIPLIDLGEKPGSTLPVVPIVNTRKPDGSNTVTGLTDLYAARLALDGFHGVSPTGTGLIKQYMPDFTTPGAVKTGEVEMIAAVALKATKAAAVFRNIKVV